ncbi:elongation factor P [Aurantiacibacter poecillastricola]|uniref:elongation factor P n=1 Tax=Aurantiacibacter poecillastricola TaxID=3064385 RepID=UPI00273E8972|nr:elongation factor P [Aurantiacibacter sp. 219JJ12-13]MDP5261878.1 elongation factor P [Aurantiacibacter sp. 219JJ12-13]
MIRLLHSRLLPSALVGALLATPALAQSEIGTVERGRYVCELPGDAGGDVGIVQDGAGFSIESASRYTSPQGGGTYLRRGNRLIMTSGPRNGDEYQIVGRRFLRKIVDGQPSRLRCIRQGR